MSTDTAIVIANTGNNFLAPATSLDIMRATYQAKKEFIEAVLKENVDYGTIPGSAKPALLKPGAEKMTSFFGLSPVFEDAQTVEDWTGADHNGEQFFYYRQRCKLYSGTRLIASADGSCNSWEKKYKWRWVAEADIPAHLDKPKLKTRGGRISEFTFSIDKAETTGKYAKPASYWKQFKDAITNGTATKIQKTTAAGKTFDAWEIGSSLYCIPNDEVSDIVNTILKMAQKRALVAATLIATNVSDYFTQDIEDYAEPAAVDAVFHDVTPPPAQPVAPTPAQVPTLPPLTKPAPINGNGHTPAPQAEAPAPVAHPERPYTPFVLKSGLLAACLKKTGKKAGANELQPVAALLDNMLGGEDQRHEFVKWLTDGKTQSLKDDGPMCLALYDWLKPVYNRDAKVFETGSEFAKAEATAAFVESQRHDGQTELPLS